MRRSQKERRATTRRRLLDAAVHELTRAGYARFTTADVVRSAELSQGALFKHFPTKTDLVGAAAGYLLSLLIDDYRNLFAEAKGDRDPIESALRILFNVFKTPRAQTAIELCVAARTDPDLKRVMAPAISAHRANLREIARELFPKQRSHPGFDRFCQMLFNTLQGNALRYFVEPDATDDDPVPYLMALTNRLMQLSSP